MRSKTQSRNLDAIEEIGASETSISSFVDVGAIDIRERERDDFKGDDMEIRVIGVEKMSPRSNDTYYHPENSKDELIEDADVGMAIPYRYHSSPRSSR